MISAIWRLRLVWLAAFLLVALTSQTGASRLSHAQSESRTFPETGKSLRGSFLQYWDAHGGLAQFGYPVSNELQEQSDIDGKVYVMQYFERAVFEYHPENQPPHDVLLSLLGTLQYRSKYPAGATGQNVNSDGNSVLFPETGKRLGGKFLEYWLGHGGVARQGYPISDEFVERSSLDGRTYKVQYFQRAVFEYHPENQPPHDVLLSQLGTFRLRGKEATRPAESALQLDFLRSEGVLYIQQEYFQSAGVPASQRGGYSQPLTTTAEYWIDARNPWRFRTEVRELLADGWRLVSASGSDGVDEWWQVDIPLGITETVRHKGRAPLLERDPQQRTEMTLDIWLETFSRPGRAILERLRRGEAEQVGQRDEAPWGQVGVIRWTETRRQYVRTVILRLAEPHILVELVDRHLQGGILQVIRISKWGWLDAQQAPAEFWLTPPHTD